MCLVIVPYVHGFLLSEMEILQTDSLSCGSNEVNHFYCAEPPLIKLACSDSYSKELSMCIVVGSSNGQSLLIILMSYLFIFVAVLQSHSATGKKKAFSTCGSHLTIVSLLWNPLLYEFEATHREVHGAGQDGGRVIHHGDPHAESCDLRPQEQGWEGCIEKNNRKQKLEKWKCLASIKNILEIEK